MWLLRVSETSETCALDVVFIRKSGMTTIGLTSPVCVLGSILWSFASDIDVLMMSKLTCSSCC